MAELVYARVSKTLDRKVLWVRVPPWALMPQKTSKVFIWSDVLAYVVGLLVTDGNLSNDGRHIIMRSSDRDLLETFKSCLNLETKIGITKTSGYSTRISYRVQFGDVLFYKWLLSVGLSPNKTYNIGEIEVPDLFFRDFLRGHFDGDGSLFKYIDRYNVYKDRSYTNLRVYLTLISASHEHILWLHKKI